MIAAIVGIALWIVLAIVVALILGRSCRLRDEREALVSVGDAVERELEPADA